MSDSFLHTLFLSKRASSQWVVFPVDFLRIPDADEWSEVHHRIITIAPWYTCWFKLLLYFLFLLFRKFYMFRAEVISSENLTEIRIKAQNWLIEGKCTDSTSAIWSDSGEWLEFFYSTWKNTTISAHHFLSKSEHIATTPIVSQSLIVWEKCIPIGVCEWFNSRKSLQKSSVVVSDSSCLSLLEHDLSWPDSIQERLWVVSIVSPRQVVATIFFIPIDDRVKRKCW